MKKKLPLLNFFYMCYFAVKVQLAQNLQLCFRSFYYAVILFLLFNLMNEAKAQDRQPNIILILADDIGYQTLGVNGGKSYSTPNIDNMAHSGMNFTQCQASPLCSPSRCMLLTGKYNFRNYTKWGQLDRSNKTIANMFQDAGYKTACYGKWQLSGGDTSIQAFGFDNYCVWNPIGPSTKSSRYKNPEIYTIGGYVADSLTHGKYGEDIFTDSVMDFVERNKAEPFFIYYPMVLAHEPFQPTPDNTDFASWNSDVASSTSYYPSMINYMDKKVGAIINKVKEAGIEDNTVIIYVGDNGTPARISQYTNDDSLIKGGKGLTTESGTHVPMIIYWPQTIVAGSINNDLIGFTDFLTTLADVANIPLPTNYGPLDGISFAPRLTGNPGTPRDWLFESYDDHPGKSELKRWAQTTTYKLYDTSSSNPGRLFYNLSKDISEKHPIADASLTTSEAIIKQQLLDVINSYVVQGTPLISLDPRLSAITSSSVVLKDTINTNGGSTITASGAVWSTSPNPEISSSGHTLSGKSAGTFSTTVTGLTGSTTYYIRAYATNFAGTAYSNQKTFSTLSAFPVATAATLIDSNKFTANWNAYNGATSYRIDVSTSPTFTRATAVTLTEGFTNGSTPPPGWTISNSVFANNTIFGSASPALEFTASGAQVITAQLSGPATQLKFWIKGLNTDSASSMLVEGFDGTVWTAITKLSKLPKVGTAKTFNATSSIHLAQNFIQFRFTYTRKAGTLAFDDVSIKYNNSTPSFITGYNNLLVKAATSKIVTGLKIATNYYYRIRAVTGSVVTANSNVITVTSCRAAIISNINKVNLICHGSQNGSIALSVTGGVAPLAYSWTGPDNFISTDKDISSLEAGTYHLNITSNGGCAVDTNISVAEPAILTATVNAEPIACAGGATTLTINASGGTGPYHYSLSDGTNTTGPQDDNHFTVVAGNYTIIVEDDNHCSFTALPIEIDDPPAITAAISADPITFPGGTTIITVTVTGGTGNYHYSLSDGTNTTDPQTDNHFSVAAGIYTVIVEDDDHCFFTTDALNIEDGTSAFKSTGIASTQNKGTYEKEDLKQTGKPKEFAVNIFPNPASKEFVLTVETSSTKPIHVIVSNLFGNKTYEATGSSMGKYVFGNGFAAGTYFVQIMQGDFIKVVKLIKSNR
jgi:arylsulfatase A